MVTFFTLIQDSHVLLVGEPGLGKSQLLQAVSGLAPRGVYVCGNTTSTAGLTVTVVKDAGSGDFALEAGALVLGDHVRLMLAHFVCSVLSHVHLLKFLRAPEDVPSVYGYCWDIGWRHCRLP